MHLILSNIPLKLADGQFPFSAMVLSADFSGLYPRHFWLGWIWGRLLSAVPTRNAIIIQAGVPLQTEMMRSNPGSTRRVDC
jgi:hypothetical protein